MSDKYYGVGGALGMLCPWLGSKEDRQLRFREPAGAHVCYAQTPPAEIELEHQASFCQCAEHTACRFYSKPLPMSEPAPIGTEVDEFGPPPDEHRSLRTALWALVAVVALVVAIVYARQLFWAPLPPAANPSPTAASTANWTPAPIPAAATPTLSILLPTPTLTPYPGGAIHALSAGSAAAGWVASDETRGNHLGDSYMYTGVYDGVIYHGIVQFDLSSVPRGATIYSAVIELTGLSATRLGQDGVWQVRALAREVDDVWSGKTFQDVHNADVQWTLLPALPAGDLGEGRVNAVALAGPEIGDLEQRLLDQHYALSIRIDGPLAGTDNVFAWDTGFSSATRGHAPRLVLNVGPAPKTPLPTGTPPLVVVTSTPTPANVFTAEARGRTATAVVRTKGAPTPTSVYQWTATPPLVVTNTPTPAGAAAATWMARWITAVAFTTGTFTPTPDYQVTATATPVMIPFASLTPTPEPPAPTPRPALPAALRGWILFESNRAGDAGPWAMDAQGQTVGLLTAPWPYEVAAGREAYSPDGTRLAYAGSVENHPALLVRPEAGGTGEAVTVLEEGSVSGPAWSPAGNWIAFVATSAGRTMVWVVHSDGSDLRQLTTGDDGSASHPTFSPDGSRVAFAVSDGGGRRQIWAIAVDGTGRVNLSNNDWDEWAPVWAK